MKGKKKIEKTTLTTTIVNILQTIPKILVATIEENNTFIQSRQPVSRVEQQRIVRLPG